MDENDKFKDLNKFLETLEKSSVKSKDYIKFVIGLSTGTLVFTATLAKEFIKTPHHQFILIIGLTCLFISIILGVWILPGGDRLQSLFEIFKRLLSKSPEEMKSLVEKSLQQYYIRDWIKRILPSGLESDERMKTFYKSLENAPLRNLRKVLEKVSELGINEPDKIRFLREFVEELLNFSLFIKIDQQASYPPILFRSIRMTIWQLIYLERVLRYTFFIGMFAILIFSIINLLH
jgi:hypothetical protein